MYQILHLFQPHKIEFMMMMRWINGWNVARKLRVVCDMHITVASSVFVELKAIMTQCCEYCVYKLKRSNINITTPHNTIPRWTNQVFVLLFFSFISDKMRIKKNQREIFTFCGDWSQCNRWAYSVEKSRVSRAIVVLKKYKKVLKKNIHWISAQQWKWKLF